MAGKDPRFEIPDQIRDFADNSIDNTRKAFDEYIQKSRETIAGLEETAEKAKSETRDVQERVLSYAEENVAAALDYARQMVNAGSPGDLMEIQRQFLESQMNALSKQAGEMSETARSAFAAMTEGKPGKK